MVNLDINKIQLRYITGINKCLAGYPTPLDILYESCVESIDDCLFSSAKMENRYGLSDEKIEDVVKYLLERGFVEKSGSKYKIINSIWQ